MRKFALLLLFTVAVLISPVFAGDYRDVSLGYTMKFPDDFYSKKDYRVQWWYFTGHLFDETGREFGYELTFFVIGVQKRDYKSLFGVNDLYISHFALSDVKENKYYFSDTIDPGNFDFSGSSENKLSVWVLNNIMEGTPEQIHLKAYDNKNAIDLVVTPIKSLVLHGKNGYSRKSEESPDIASYYFSYTHMKTSGTITIGQKVFTVNGKSWFDREISTRGLGKKQAGWDWFALQLDDDREIMLYVIRNIDNSIDRYSSGTFIYADGKYRHLSSDDFEVVIKDNYKSKKTEATYPSKWTIKIPSENLEVTVTPFMVDQEFIGTHSTGNYYWEGKCIVEGTAQGRAFVEMTGY
jgi:predicted secreted hydrolase